MKWGWLVLGALGSLGVDACRDHAPVCADSECVSIDDGGAGMASVSPVPVGGDAGGEAAAAGAPPACTDEGCDNGTPCDGQETCRDGQCISGEPIACDDGMVCDDEASMSCVFEEPSPWLLLISEGNLWGSPVAELSKGADLIRLFTKSTEPSEIAGSLAWAPDGSRAVLATVLPQFTNSHVVLPMGRSVPSGLGRIRELPSWLSAEFEVHFSNDSRFAFAYDHSGTYLIRVEREMTAVAQVPPRRGEFQHTSFCEPSHTWVQWGQDESVAVGSFETRELVVRDLGEHASFRQSADGRLLALEPPWSEASGITLTSCSLAEWSVEFPEAHDAVFSADSRRLWLSFWDKPGQAIYSLEDPEHPVELLYNTDTDLELNAVLYGGFSPDGRHVLAQRGNQYLVVDVDAGLQAAPTPIGDQFDVSVERMMDDAVIYWVSSETGRNLMRRAFDPSSEPQLLIENPEELFRNPHRRELLYAVIASEDADELYELDWSGTAVPRKLLSARGDIDSVSFSEDGRAIAFVLSQTDFTSSIYFAPIDSQGELGAVRRLANDGYQVEFQPWP